MAAMSFASTLAKVAETKPCPRLNVGLANGNRVSLVNWELVGDCLREHRSSGRLHYLVPLAQIVIIEVLDGE